HGKLASDLWLRSEDLLTSAVFGSLKYLEPAAMSTLFRRSRPLDGNAAPVLLGPLAWHFWPWWDTCEPDVVIEDDHNLCVVEVKLYSEFGESEAIGHQLSREWLDGLRWGERSGKALWLVAVTNHLAMPTETLRRQLRGTTADLTRVC